MPQASSEFRAKIKLHFGSIDDSGPTKFLMESGWREVANGLWRSPKLIDEVSEKEFLCIMFLRDEWDHDYVGVIEEKTSNG